jgi:P4 family phage/plasmid primase-like protien
MIAAAGRDLKASERAHLATILKGLHPSKGVGKGDILLDIKDAGKLLKEETGDNAKDQQLEFIQMFLDEWYRSGKLLRRTGRQFWEYRKNHWVQGQDESIQGKFFKTLVDLRTRTPKKERRALQAAIGETQTSAIFSSLWQMFIANTAHETDTSGLGTLVDPMGLRRRELPKAINCANGTVEFNDKGQFRLRRSNPDDLFTSVVDVPFDVDAECPLWDHFCKVTFSKASDRKGMQRHLEELTGYILNQSRSLRAWVLLCGATASGKSTYGAILNNLLGDTAKNMTMGNYDKNSHATAGLIGKQLLVDDDYPMGLLLNDGFLKSVSELKHMDANPKGRDEIPFIARVVPVILSNHPPATRDVSDALNDRALVFPFNNSIPRGQRDGDLVDKIVANELPGILLRAVKGMARLTRRGDWEFPIDCSQAWHSWILQSNPVRMFAHECLEERPGAVSKASDIWDAWRMWQREEHGAAHDPRTMGKRNAFYTKIEQVFGVARVRHNKDGLIFRGWAVNPKYVTDDDTDWTQ